MLNETYDFYFLHFPQTKRLFSIFKKYDIEARFVGGCVRDAIIEKHTDDFDIAVKFDILELKSILETDGVLVIPTGIKYGSITVIIDRVKFEITSLRMDFDCSGRACKTKQSSSFEGDAKRRDFTMNALYVSESGELFDYFNGIEDLKKRDVIFECFQFFDDVAKNKKICYISNISIFRTYIIIYS